MSRYERHATRSLVYSKWHRFYLGDQEPMIDLDGVEYCNERGCSKPLILIETARDVGQWNKPTTVMRELAKQSGGLLALCALYTIDPEVNEQTGCPCEPNAVNEACNHGVISFRIKKVWPSPARTWTVMMPEEFRDRLRMVRMKHIEVEHHAWEDAS